MHGSLSLLHQKKCIFSSHLMDFLRFFCMAEWATLLLLRLHPERPGSLGTVHGEHSLTVPAHHRVVSPQAQSGVSPRVGLVPEWGQPSSHRSLHFSTEQRSHQTVLSSGRDLGRESGRNKGAAGPPHHGVPAALHSYSAPGLPICVLLSHDDLDER